MKIPEAYIKITDEGISLDIIYDECGDHIVEFGYFMYSDVSAIEIANLLRHLDDMIVKITIDDEQATEKLICGDY